MKYEIPQMIQRRAGAIVNMASGADVIGIPQTPIYDASKHAVLGLTKSAAIAADLVFEFTEAIGNFIITRTSQLNYQSSLLEPLRLLTYLGKLQCLESVWDEY
jgi:short-subunit dehydrogenase involved in D-alanine esterification of teichoic acids